MGRRGRELFYMSPGTKLMVVDLKMTENSVEPLAPRELFRLPIDDNGYLPFDTAPDGKRFLVRATPEKDSSQPLSVIINWPALLKNASK